MSPVLRVPPAPPKVILSSQAKFLHTNRRKCLLAEFQANRHFLLSVFGSHFMSVFSQYSQVIPVTAPIWVSCFPMSFSLNCLSFNFTTCFLPALYCNCHFHFTGKLSGHCKLSEKKFCPMLSINMWKGCFACLPELLHYYEQETWCDPLPVPHSNLVLGI